MSRYIDEDLVNLKLKQICDERRTSYGVQFGGRAKDFAQLTNDIPNAAVVEVKHGKWQLGKSGCMYFCSQCSYAVHPREVDEWGYCPRCGARMDGE